MGNSLDINCVNHSPMKGHGNDFGQIVFPDFNVNDALVKYFYQEPNICVPFIEVHCINKLQGFQFLAM